MGSYSHFDFEDIEVVDKEGLMQYLELNKDNELVQMLSYDKERNELTFEGWSEIKLISYWYREQRVILKQIAAFINGQVHWTFETKDEAAYVEFEDGECTINTGEMQYTGDTPDGLRDNIKEPVIEMPEWILQRIAARRI